ncbi:MAG: tRNA (adenosine(37)-N6)-threonylcarbamoyltransferase complex ATPase subunit type 1 TsaE [Aquisalimonadaceae bacterium]
MTASVQRLLEDEPATMALGSELAAAGRGLPRQIVYLHGDLGAGKTTLVRGMLRALGHAGIVRSPTYTLLEPYDLADRGCLHLDLYRLADAGELDYIGLRELLSGPVLVLVEWPERGLGALPEPDLSITLSYRGTGREAVLEASSDVGARLLESLPG